MSSDLPRVTQLAGSSCELLASRCGVRPALTPRVSRHTLYHEALTSPSSWLDALAILWMWHLQHPMALFMPLFSPVAVGSGKARLGPIGRVNEQLMDQRVPPRQAQRAQRNCP